MAKTQGTTKKPTKTKASTKTKTKTKTKARAKAKAKPPSTRAVAKKRAPAKTKAAASAIKAAKAPSASIDASRLIDQRIVDLGGWRGETLARMRALVLECDPEMIEEWKWMGTPVWSCRGIVCTGEAYKAVVKLTFARGASLPDPARLFNSSLEGNTRRAIDIHEGEQLDAEAFKALVKAAVALNRSLKKR